MSWDEPDEPDVIDCPYCEEPLGENADKCEHCSTTGQLAKERSAHQMLRHHLGCRVRVMLELPFASGGLQPALSHMHAVGMLMELAGLPLPETFVRHARAHVVGEYGEHQPFGVSDDQLVERFLGWFTMADRQESAESTFTAAMLDAKPRTTADQLYFGMSREGKPSVFTHAEKRLGRGDGGSTQWGATLRETINMALERRDFDAAFWLEFYRDYMLGPEAKLADGGKISYVVGTEAYTAHIGEHVGVPRFALGFGGDKFEVLLSDGRKFTTRSNWGRGTVPLALRKLLPANALFVPASTEQAVGNPEPREDHDA